MTRTSRLCRYDVEKRRVHLLAPRMYPRLFLALLKLLLALIQLNLQQSTNIKFGRKVCDPLNCVTESFVSEPQRQPGVLGFLLHVLCHETS